MAEINCSTWREELQALVGLEDLKRQLKELETAARLQQKEGRAGGLGRNALFTGGPGTGKTTLAVIYAKMLMDLGLVRERKLVSLPVTALESRYVGGSAENLRKAVEEAMGGVLLIDEVHLLSRMPEGTEILRMLVYLMVEYRDELTVVLMGYEDGARAMLAADPGLPRRLRLFRLPD